MQVLSELDFSYLMMKRKIEAVWSQLDYIQSYIRLKVTLYTIKELIFFRKNTLIISESTTSTTETKNIIYMKEPATLFTTLQKKKSLSLKDLIMRRKKTDSRKSLKAATFSNTANT